MPSSGRNAVQHKDGASAKKLLIHKQVTYQTYQHLRIPETSQPCVLFCNSSAYTECLPEIRALEHEQFCSIFFSQSFTGGEVVRNTPGIWLLLFFFFFLDQQSKYRLRGEKRHVLTHFLTFEGKQNQLQFKNKKKSSNQVTKSQFVLELASLLHQVEDMSRTYDLEAESSPSASKTLLSLLNTAKTDTVVTQCKDTENYSNHCAAIMCPDRFTSLKVF